MKFKNEKEVRIFLGNCLIDSPETEIGYLGFDRFKKEKSNLFSVFAQGVNWKDKGKTWFDLETAINRVVENNYKIKDTY